MKILLALVLLACIRCGAVNPSPFGDDSDKNCIENSSWIALIAVNNDNTLSSDEKVLYLAVALSSIKETCKEERK